MPAEQNKQLATDFLARFTAGDIDGALATLSDDATWRLPGKPGQMPVVGVFDKARIGKLFRNMDAQLKSGLKMTPTGMVAEGDKVAVEAVSRGELRNGRVYEQEYHFLMVVRDGKIREVREYLDTQHVLATWFA
ncbi:MAG TPA: nuclear transport factor 2 family protein [Albitalea sp.]|uniref:nuclear transport factor 2 family protein n=1 Tax=Piscinibacter sp. TaxID=1903157 RepID=UPI002ED56255